MDDHPRRRQFLLASMGGVGAALAAATGLPIYRYLAPRMVDGGNGQVTLQKADLSGAHFFQFKGKPAVILETAPGEYRAMTAVCTHLGCIVKHDDEAGVFVCPCHGGRFSHTGEVVGGPPPAPLETYPVALDGDKIVIG